MIPLVVYLVIGGVAGVIFDRWEMKEHVPYGSFPSVLPLKNLRVAVMLLHLLFGPFWLVPFMIKSAYYYLAFHYHGYMAFRKLDKLTKDHPHLSKLVQELKEKYYASERSSSSRADEAG